MKLKTQMSVQQENKPVAQIDQKGCGIEVVKPVKKSAFWDPRSARFRLTMVLMVAVMANTLVRNTLSMAMVCMVNGTALQGDNKHLRHSENLTKQGPCPVLESDMKAYDGPLIWDSNDQGLLFSAMYWGGVISAIPAGFLADRYNPKIIISFCLTINLIGCLLTPITAMSGGLIPVFILRVIMGLGGQATIFPSIAAITARWIPPAERSTVIALYTAGSQVASIIGGPLNGFLCSQKAFLGGWPSIFYVTGIVTVPTVVLWFLAISNSPEEAKLMMDRERKLIQKALQKQNVQKKKVPFKDVPWKKMLTSMAVIVAMLGNLTLAVMNSTLTAYIPTYFKQSLKMNLSSNGALSALPFISQWLGKIVFATISDQLKAKTKLSHTWICRIFNCIGTFGVAAFLIACAYMDCTKRTLAVTFVTIANGLFSCQVPGFLTSLVCIAPLYSGMVNALSRFVGQVGSVVAPYVVGAITVDGTSNEWRTVFLIMSGVMVFTGVLFLIFGSADIQEWAKPKPQDQDPRLASIAVATATTVSNSTNEQYDHELISDSTFVCRL